MSHYCPRRDDMARSFAGGLFYFDPEVQIGTTKLEDEWRPDGNCSYCGSARPATFIRYIELGGVVEPTDKRYKAYLRDAEKLEEAAGVASAQMANGSGKFYFQHIAHPSPERARFYDLFIERGIANWYSGAPVGLRLEHIARHPDVMGDAERAALEAFRERNPGVAAP